MSKIVPLLILCEFVVIFCIISIGISILIQPYMFNTNPDESGDTITHQSKWYYDGNTYVVKYDIDMGQLKAYNDSQIVRNLFKSVYTVYANDYTDTIRQIADQIDSYSEGMSDYQRICMVSSFVDDTILYKDDAVGPIVSDYFQYPLETLYLRTGDCEDMAILGTAILKAMGYDAEVMFSPGHALVGVNVDYFGNCAYSISGTRYMTLDVTSGGVVGGYSDDIIVVANKELAFVEFVAMMVFLTIIGYFIVGTLKWYRE